MGEIFMIQTRDITEEITPGTGLSFTVPQKARILIVGDHGSDTERLETVFRDAEMSTETANSIAAGCEAAKSGRFQSLVPA